MLDLIIIVVTIVIVCRVHRLHRGLRAPVGKERLYEHTPGVHSGGHRDALRAGLSCISPTHAREILTSSSSKKVR